MPSTSDRNANSASEFLSTTADLNLPPLQSPKKSIPDHLVSSAVGGTVRKLSRALKVNNVSSVNNGKNSLKKRKHNTAQNDQSLSTADICEEVVRDANYMQLEFCDPSLPPSVETVFFKELFCDFPVSYESTDVITIEQFENNTLVMKPPPQPPPYREPPPPTPPPISQLPTRDPRLFAVESATTPSSAPVTPSRGKVVLSKKERKELSKLHKLLDNGSSSISTVNDNNRLSTCSLSANSSPYKGRVTELKNCIAKINSRGLFASLNRGSHKFLSPSHQQCQIATPPSSNETSPPAPAPDSSPPPSTDDLSANNNDGDYTEKLKNLPVRQRKVHISHLENYCLFDPVDFINEKNYRGRSTPSIEVTGNVPTHGLRDPLFSSSRNLDFGDEELVPEVIYPEQRDCEQLEIELKQGGAEACCINNVIEDSVQIFEDTKNFDHHNYFVIDPEDFEEETLIDIGIPNPLSNEQFLNAKLEETFEVTLPVSSSIDKLVDISEVGSSLSNSQESKDITTTASSTTTSTALLESSTSTTSNSSSTSSASTSQTTLQRTKKKLTFLNLSPFRSQHSKTNENEKSSKKSEPMLQIGPNEHKSTDRAISELISSDHILHLQHMLLHNKDNMRSRTVPIESNYVLFNPGPVPSRNIQYKIRKPRPLSTHSDADSGFLSPCSPDELAALKFNPAILVLQQCDSVQGYIEIYTDWANYYLERAKSKKKVTDLSADCRDGLLLADVIEAVTSFKVPDLVKKPKNQQQMYENVNSCLNVLRSQEVGGLDTITTSDICAGRLKAVLALFFALSRHKQQQQQRKSENGNDTMVNRQIPNAYTKSNGGTSIPLPATVMVQRRCPPDKVRPLPPTPNHTPSIPNLGKSNDFNSSLSNCSPTNHAIQGNKNGNNNSLRLPNSKLSHQQSGIPPPTTITTAVSPVPTPQKHSMLDKLKLFNKEKTQNATASPNLVVNKTPAHSKRTSSSSGFSSARSERSDSSLSLNDGHISQIKPPTANALGTSKNRDLKLSTKQSKLLAAQMKKEQVKASKLEKKEKSPARSLNKEENSANTENKNSTIGRSKNSLPRLSEKNSTKTSSKNSLHSKSESKSSLILPPSKNLNSPNGTGLPKPVAAIKGTSKLPQTPPTASKENRPRILNSGSNNELLKREKSDISGTSSAHISADRSNSQHTHLINNSQQHIVKPVPIIPESSNITPFYANTSNISQQNTTTQRHVLLNESTAFQQPEPTYVSNNSRLPPPKTSGLATPTQKLEYTSGSNLLSSPQRMPHHLQSWSQPSTPVSSPSKFHTIPSKVTGVGTIFEDEKPVNVLPMRPLLRGYNSHVTLPSRGARGRHDGGPYSNGLSEFFESDNNQGGYCSDSDSLRIRNMRLGHGSAIGNSRTLARNHDADFDGYLSEGSGGMGHHNSPIGGSSHGKHFLSMMRARTQLPTTIEERIRNSRGSLDSIGTAPPSSIASQASSGDSNNKMDGNSNNTVTGSGNASVNASPHHQAQHGHRSSSRSCRENWSKATEPPNGHKSERSDKSSPSHSKRNVTGSSSGGSSKQGSPSSRTKGVPPSFGYVKRANGSATATAEQQNIVMMGATNSNSNIAQNCNQSSRTAHVSAVPRTNAGGRKISGGTQTLPSEHMSRIPPTTQHRSFSLTGPGATQLSQSIRERLAAGSHSLPKPGTDLHMFQHRIANRPSKMIDGSLSDTQTYAEVKPEYSTYAIWLKHSSTAGSRLSEGDSLENMQIGSPAITRHGHKMLQHRNATIAIGNTHGGGNESPYVQSPRLNRSNSIRSTKSEKMYPSMLSRGSDVEIEPYYCLPVGTIGAQNGVISAQMAAVAAAAATHISGQANANSTSVAWSQPTSPIPLSRGFGGTLSPTHSNALAIMGLTSAQSAGHRLTYPKKNDEVHGSAASLLSGGSSLYGSAEERQANEIRRLKRELMDAREQVLSLSSQLSTNLQSKTIKVKFKKKTEEPKLAHNSKEKCEVNISMKHYERDTDRIYHDDSNNYDNCSAVEYCNSDEVKILLNACDRRKKTVTVPVTGSKKVAMSTASTHRPPSAPIYDGYATIRSRGLYRSRSIRASTDLDHNGDDTVQYRPAVERKRTLSLLSNLSQGSNGSGSGITSNSGNNSPQNRRSSGMSNVNEDIYSNRPVAKPVKTPTIVDFEPLYATAQPIASNKGHQAMSDASSLGGRSNIECRDSIVGSAGSGSAGIEYQNLKKNSRFSLESLQSSATPKTPDYTTCEEENIFLYTAPESPKRNIDRGMRSSYEGSENGYEITPRSSFEIVDHIHRTSLDSTNLSPLKTRRSPLRSASNVGTHYQRTHSFGENIRSPRQNPKSYERSESENFSYSARPPVSPTVPPAAPVRRESLYLKPKSYTPISKTNQVQKQQDYRSNSSLSLRPPTPTNIKCNQLLLPNGHNRSSSTEMLQRSYTNQSLATIDQDEILIVPNAMPVLQNPYDRRYHTLGHMRVHSLGTSLYRPYETSPMGSMVNMTSESYHNRNSSAQRYQTLLQSSHKSAGNIYLPMNETKSRLSHCMTSEYVDPLDFKVGCQTTLRSKPIIPWYELATRDFKRKSCPQVSGSGLTIACNTTTLSTENQAHVVAAFEQSLSNMTSRLQQLTATAERKDGELTDMRQTIELLRKQSIQAGLTTAHMQSMGVQTQAQNELLINKPPALPTSNQQQTSSRVLALQQNGANDVSSSHRSTAMQRHHSTDSMCSLNSASSSCSAQDKKQKKKGWLRSSFTKAFSRNAKISKTSRHVGHHHQNQQPNLNHGHSHTSKDNGIASLPKTNGHSNHGETIIGLAALATQPAPPIQNANPVGASGSPSKGSPAKTVTLIENAKPIDAIDHDEHHIVEELKKQLREKDLVLTDIRLEALSSASQLESLKETVNKMRAEMMTLKQNNERLQKMVTSRSLAGSEASLGNAVSPSGSIGESRRYSLADGNTRPPMELPTRLEEEVEEENIPPAPAPEPPPISPTHTHIDLTPPPPALDPISSPAHISTTTEDLPDMTDGKKIAIACYLGQPESFTKYFEEMLEADDFYANSIGDSSKITERPKSFSAPSLNEFIIAYTYISGKTTWQNLDYIVRKTFKDYLSTIDPGTNLGLNTDSITSYHLGDAKRGPEMGFPELLPCGYIIGNVRTLYICLQGVGSLAFDSLIPRSIVHRYISLMTEHRRLILCGPSGTGKSYLARRLAEFLVARSGRGNPSEAIATFNVDHKSSKELRQYLGHIAEQAAIANGVSELPSVIILDNLHHASALGDVFSCLLSAGPAAKLPCIIGTMSQATCNTTNLQLHHNFRWVLTANHMEPVKGFLGRFLRRRLFQLELQTQHSQPELAAVLAWLPSVWQHINRFLETHSSSDVTIGPRLFLSCPLDLKDSQVWFTDIWNYHLSPYLVEAVREGVQLYGRRGGAWNDPSAFIRNSYPWSYGPDSVPPLRQINAEDVGLEGVTTNINENPDPLLNMLMRLQEAANYSENQDQESDCASLDSNITPDSSAGAE